MDQLLSHPLASLPALRAIRLCAALAVTAGATACSDQPQPLAPSVPPIAPAAVQGKPSKIAFTSGPFANAGVYVIKADGTGLKSLIDGPGADRQAAYSPDGRRIAFVSDRGGAEQIYVARSDGRNPAPVTSFNAGEYPSNPSWSPDGARIAFSRQAGGNTDIYMINVDGSGLARLTDAAAADEDPAWSPDGSEIAFVSRRDGNAEVYLMAANGSGQVPFTACLLHCFAPAWSPTGQAISYQSGSALQIQPVAGGAPVQVASDLDESGAPAWSPDGSELVFVAFDANGQRDLFAVQPAGAGLRRITNTPAVESWPSWKK